MQKLRQFLLRMIIICMILVVMCGQTETEGDLPRAVLGEPSFFTESFDVNWIRIGQLLHDQKRLYLLDDQNGYIRVFDLNGNYLYSILLYDYLNGAFRMAVNEEMLYIADPHNDVYIFANDTFVEFLERQDAKVLLNSLNFQKKSDTFELRLGSVYNVTNDMCIIERRLYAARKSTEIFAIGFVVLIALVHYYRRAKK